MKVRLAIRPKIETNDPFFDPLETDNEAWAYRLRHKAWALRWLGERYLLAQPINKRSNHEQSKRSA